MLFRLYVGSNNATHKLESKKAINVVSKSFQGFTTSTASGYWQGKAEKSLVIEIETEDSELIKSVSKELCKELSQDAVGVAQIGKMEFIS